MNMQVPGARRDASGGYKVDVTRGTRVGRVSSEWFSRPDDERFLSLGDLVHAVRGRSERSRTRVVESALIHVEANRNDPGRLALILPGADAPVTPTHWSFGQMASQVGAPAAYLRQLPAPLAAINLQYGLTSHRAEQIKTLETDDPVSGRRLELRAVTGPDYGRIYDHELIEAVQKIAGNGTGDTRWKVPGVLDWSTGVYNPRVDATRDTTTLYASDRDVLLAWNRLILPDERSIVLERQPASDPGGFAGLQDGTNYHWGGVLKAALVSTLLGVGSELGSGNDGDLTRAVRRGTQDSVNRAGEQIVSRELNVRPTLTIRPGYPVRVLVTRDLVFGGD